MSEIKSIRKIWSSMIKNVLENGTTFPDRRGRECIELLNQTYVFTPEQFPTIREPVQFLSSFSEWIYPDVDEIKQIILEINQSPHYAYSYANRLFAFNDNVNQIDDNIIPLLEKSPTTRQAIMGFLNPLTDKIPNPQEKPSLTSIQFLYRNNQLHLTATIRSCDLFFGFPANLIQLHAVLLYVCEKAQLQSGNITIFCTSAHVFGDQKPYINKLLNEK